MMTRQGAKMTASTNAQRTMTFENFLARQSFRDEAMASASAGWLASHPDGLLLGMVGVNHAKFSCGVPARTARMLPGGLDVVKSVLLNPTAANSYVDPMNLRICDRTAVANEACVRNDIEVQNYVLQLQLPDGNRQPVDQDESVWAMQAKRGRSVLALSDYMIFSPTN